MRRVFLLLFCFVIMFSYTNVFANIMCNDGTRSPSCGDCHRGCCSHHGGCASGGSSIGVALVIIIETIHIQDHMYMDVLI